LLAEGAVARPRRAIAPHGCRHRPPLWRLHRRGRSRDLPRAPV